MLNNRNYQTEADEQRDSTVTESLETAIISQEYVDRLAADLIKNETINSGTAVFLITTQEQIDRFVVDLLKNDASVAG